MTKLNTFCLILMVLGILHITYGVQDELKSSYDRKRRAPVTINRHQYVEPKGFSKTKVDKFRQAILDLSNDFRDMHELEKFELNEYLNNSAQEWANTLAKTKEFHDPQNRNLHMPKKKLKYGEVIFRGYEMDYGKYGHFTAVAVKSWFLRIAIFHENMKEEEFVYGKGYDDVTQVLWKSSKQIGIGVSKSTRSKTVIFVCVHFFPPGNKKNHFLDNLPTITIEQINIVKEPLKKLHDAMGVQD